MSDLLLYVLTDLAFKRQTRSVFSAEDELRGARCICLSGERVGAANGQVMKS